MRRAFLFTVSFASAVFLFALPVAAQVGMTEATAKANLQTIYENRADLQKIFTGDGALRPDAVITSLPDLGAWAVAYGHKEYPELLAWYAPDGPPDQPAVLSLKRNAIPPKKTTAGGFDPSVVTASQFLVVDDGSRKVLIAHDIERRHSIASITKLMTAIITVDRAVPIKKKVAMLGSDELGGARLQVKRGSSLTLNDLMYAMLVGSANNAASAVARSTGLSKTAFVREMNRRAGVLGLAHTTFADPTGLDPANVSTPAEIAALALEAWKRPTIRRITSTSEVTVMAGGKAHLIRNTNALLTDADNGLVVLGGKTGYLEESMWNFVVRMKDATHPPLVVVVFGSADRRSSFSDAEKLARWTWDHYTW